MESGTAMYMTELRTMFHAGVRPISSPSPPFTHPEPLNDDDEGMSGANGPIVASIGETTPSNDAALVASDVRRELPAGVAKPPPSPPPPSASVASPSDPPKMEEEISEARPFIGCFAPPPPQCSHPGWVGDGFPHENTRAAPRWARAPYVEWQRACAVQPGG